MLIFIETIYQFFNYPFFVIVGGIFTVIILLGFIVNFIFLILGIWPLLWRLGFGRWTRKIAIVANDEVYGQLRKDLVNSGIFRENNISPITSKSLAEVKERDLLLVHYQSFSEDQIKTILSNKKSRAGMVFYYPEFSPKEGKKIPDDMVKLIGDQENTTVVNFRGRLLNDIITTLITTSYEKR